MSSYFTCSAVVVTPSGSYDTRGTYRVTGDASETDMKAAIAREVAAEQRCDWREVIVLDFVYSQIS